MKPPGIFERIGSTFSSASTVATVAEDAEAEHAPEKLTTEVTRDLRCEHVGIEGHVKVQWPVDARRLRGKDKQMISPSFEIIPGCSFKLMVKPKSVGDKKGQASFHRARGWGSVELKLVEGTALAPTLCFRISVGGGLPRGPVQHDFGNCTVGGLGKSEEYFDFASSVDPHSSSFVIFLETFPCEAAAVAPRTS